MMTFRRYPESRAVAQLISVVRKSRLSQTDEDALTIYRLTCLVTAAMLPDYDDLGATAAYQRGSELAERYDKKAEPLTGTVDERIGVLLERAEICGLDAGKLHEENVAEFRAAWKRQIPDVECPIRIESGIEWHRLRDTYGAAGYGPPQGGWYPLNQSFYEGQR